MTARETPVRTVRGKDAPQPDAARESGAEPHLLDLVLLTLDDDQADDIAVVDLSGKTAIADYMVVASGRNTRHIAAMADHLKERIKTQNRPSPPVEGLPQADWVLIDGGDVVIHLFRPEIRDLYNLEKMWAAALTAPDPEAGPEDPLDATAAPATGDATGDSAGAEDSEEPGDPDEPGRS